MERKMICGILLTILCMLGSVAWATTTWYVNGVSGSDTNNCLSASTPCNTIGNAISLASSGDSIIVAGGTYTENLTIAFDLKVSGSAGKTIIDGGRHGTVVTVSTPTAHVNLANVTITNGFAASGGGIANHGILTVNHSIVQGNIASHPARCVLGCHGRGGGIYNDGRLIVNNSTVTGNAASVSNGCLGGCGADGGGITNSLGTVTLNNSTVSNNMAFYWRRGGSGGGIQNSGTVNLNNSTVANNSAVGGVASGGGIDNSSTSLTAAILQINNSTISGNFASYQGGGIENYSASATIQNSIVANSSGGNCSGAITSKGYNVSSDGTCRLSGPGDMHNTDPLLGPLQNNGGPTQTMALLPGSPAIDAGNPSGCTDGQGHLLKTDQRGMPRPDKEDIGGCDMGAYESRSD